MKTLEVKYKDQIYYTMIDDVDEEYVKQFSWWMSFDNRTSGKYCTVRRNRTKSDDQSLPEKIKLHQEIFRRKMGRDPRPGLVIDHKDVNTLNNTRDNLRELTVKENLKNNFRNKHLVS